MFRLDLGPLAMNEIVAEAVQQSQVGELAVLVIAVDMMDLNLVIHQDVQAAMGTPSALMFQEFPSDGGEPEVFALSRAPVAPVAIIRAGPRAQDRMSFDMGIRMAYEAIGLTHDTVRAPTFWLEVRLQEPCGAFMGVFPFGPAVYFVPKQVVEPAKGFGTHLRLVVVAPTDDLPVESHDHLVERCGAHPFYRRRETVVMGVDALFAGFDDGLVGLVTARLVLSHRKLPNREAQEVKAHVSVAFLRCCEGVGEPCFRIFECESHAGEPFLDGLFASLDAFPRIVEDDEIVGIANAMGGMVDRSPFSLASAWSTSVFYCDFEAMKRNVRKEGGKYASLRRPCLGWQEDAVIDHSRFEPRLDRTSKVGAGLHLFQERCLIDFIEAAGDICIQHIARLQFDHLKDLSYGIVA